MSIPFTFFNPYFVTSILQELREAVESASLEPTETERQQLRHACGDRH